MITKLNNYFHNNNNTDTCKTTNTVIDKYSVNEITILYHTSTINIMNIYIIPLIYNFFEKIL
jgi:hypothetical protein